MASQACDVTLHGGIAGYDGIFLVVYQQLARPEGTCGGKLTQHLPLQVFC